MLEAQTLTLPEHPRIRLAPQRGIVSIAAWQNTVPQLRAALQDALPITPTRRTVGNTQYLWSGVDTWLAISPDPGLEIPIRAAAQHFAAITDQSDGRVILRVISPTARQDLAKLLPIDLHPSVFTPASTALTLAGRIGIQIWQADDGAFELACLRSYARSLYDALKQAI